MKPKHRLIAFSITIALVAIGIFASTATHASSTFAPYGLKATPLSSSSIRFEWKAGQGNVWYCVDTATNLADLYVFKDSWQNHGCWNTKTTLDVHNLKCDTVYYWRVFAWNQTTNGHSVALSVQTPPCVIGQPSNLTATDLSDSNVRLSWTAGVNNRWYCVDVAQSLEDLHGLKGTWRNHGCWTTETSITLAGLPCGVTHHWLVYAWNESTNTKSGPASFTPSKCIALAPIDDLRIDVLESQPVRYRLIITAGLPNGCAEPGSHAVTRDGNTINVVVRNLVVGHDQCALVYGTYEIGIDLGTNFQPGVRYTVNVNDEVTRFTAQ